MKRKEIKNIGDSGFKVPQDYFQTVNANILNKINTDNSFELNEDHGFSVPENYFKEVESTIIKHTLRNDKKVIKLLSWKNAAYISGIAASLLVFFNLMTLDQNKLDFDSLETSSIETFLSEKDFNTYEMAQILELNDISLYNVSDSDIPEAMLEDYLLEHNSINDLIKD